MRVILPCSDRASHFWLTPEAGEPVDRQRLTQVGRALRDLHIAMIPAYSPQARGRSERNFGTWQGRLPQELRLRGITTVEQANRFLRESYIAEFDRKFRVVAAQPESAFVPASGKDLGRIFAVQQERVVNQDKHRADRQPHAADRGKQMARHAGQVPRAGLRASGRHLERVLRPASGRPLHPRRRTRRLCQKRVRERKSRTPRGISSLYRRTRGGRCGR